MAVVVALVMFFPSAAFAEEDPDVDGTDGEVVTTSTTPDEDGSNGSGTDGTVADDGSTDTGTSDNSSTDEVDEQTADSSSDPDSTSTTGSDSEEPQTGDDEEDPVSETQSDDPADDQEASDNGTDDTGGDEPEQDLTATASAQEPEDGDEEGDTSTGGDCYTAEIDNTIVDPDTETDFTITFTETGDDDLGSAQVTIPDGFTSISFDPETGISTSDSQSWHGSLDGQVISLWADSSSDYLGEDESVSATFTATTPSTAGPYTFETDAWQDAANGEGIGETDNDMADGYSDPKVAVVGMVTIDNWEAGNATFECNEAGCDAEYAFKIDNWDGEGENGYEDNSTDYIGDGTYSTNGNNIIIDNSTGISTFDWSSKYPVSCVIVKASTGANVYYYGEAYSGTGLVGYEDKDISHVTFCFNAPADNPGISVQKSVWEGSAWQDADTEPGPYLVSQDPVTFKFEITNTGNVDLVNVELTDTDIDTFCDDSSLTNQITFPITLAVGESLTAYGSLDWVAGQHENTAEVTGSTQDGESVEDDDACHYFGANPAIVIEKTTNNVDADDPNGPEIEEGQTVTWRYVVTNIGNVPLTNINVTDDQGVTPVFASGDNNGDGILDPNETWIYSATGVATVGPYSNVGSVSGWWAQIQTVVNDTDLSHYLGTAIQNPPEDPPGPPPGPPYYPPGPPYFPPGPPVNPPAPPVSDLDIPPESPGTQPEEQTLELEPEEPGTQPEEQVLLLDPEAPGTTPDSGGTILPMLGLSIMLISGGAVIRKFKVK